MDNFPRNDNFKKMIYTADKNEQTDSAYHTLVKHISYKNDIVMVNWAENFVFNERLLEVKDYILICYCEYGYDWDMSKSGSHIWGHNSEYFPRYYTGEWVKFDNWVKENKPRLILKRELLAKDVSDTVKPIDYTTHLEPVPLQSEAEFNARPITACYYFGRSHEARLKLHASVWEGATKYGYSVCDNIYYFNGFMQFQDGRKYVSMYIPHYQRHPIETVLAINGMAKFGLAPFGAGQKTFRAAEVSANAIMIMWRDELAWGAEWVNGLNCFKCDPGEEVELIEELNKCEGLYEVYKNGVATWDKYRTEKYLNNYLLPLINNL